MTVLNAERKMSKPNFQSLSKLLKLDQDERKILRPLSKMPPDSQEIPTELLEDPPMVAALLEKLYNHILKTETEAATWRRLVEEAVEEAQEALDGDSNDAEHDALYDLVQFLS